MADNKPSIQVDITIDGVTTHKKVKMDSFVIGRHADCDVNVLHPQVSRQHLRISVLDNKIYFEDLGSSNGTYLDKKRVEKKKSFILEAEESLQLGEDGPVIQIHFAEKSTALSTLSKLESLIAPILPKNGPQPGAINIPTPPSQAQKVIQVAPASAFTPPKQSMPVVAPAMPMSPPANSPKDLKESEKVIQEANKQAALILQKAELQAEAKAQESYKHAIETEQKAESIYSERLKAANTEAEKVYQVTREETQKLLQEARAQAEQLREQAQKDARELRKLTEDKCTEFMEDAEAQAQQLKNKRLSEADQIIEKKGQELLKSTYEEIEKHKAEAQKTLDNLKTQTSKAREDHDDAKSELSEIEKEIREAKAQLKQYQEEAESKKANFERIKSDEKNMLSHIELMKKEIAEQEKIEQKHKSEVEKLSLTVTSLKQEKEDKEKEMTSELQVLKEKVEQEKEAINKREADRTNQLKLETADAIKKFEKELIEEIMSRKTQMAKEILLQMEATCPSVAVTDEWKSKQADLDQIIQDIIGSSDQASAKKVADSKSKGRMSTRTKEKTMSMALGLALGVLIIVGLQRLDEKYGDSPIDRVVASAVDAAKADLEKRKFNPPQTSEVRNNYVDSVIFTKGFTETYLDPKFQEAWNKAATMYLLKTWRLDEDSSTKALATAAALVKDLSEKRENIHPDFVKQNVAKMRNTEKEAVARLKTELGGEVRLESFKRFERKFFEKYDRLPANTTPAK